MSSNSYRDWVQVAKLRWLTPEELNMILNNYEAIGFPKNLQKPQHPRDGSIFIYDRAEVPDFKHDGVEWTKKKGSNKIYELFIKLNCGGVHTITGLYYTCSSNPHFRRRCYRLASKQGVSQLYLVHYRDCSKDMKLRQASQQSRRNQFEEICTEVGNSDQHEFSGDNELKCHPFEDFGLSFGDMEDSTLVHEMLQALDSGDFSLTTQNQIDTILSHDNKLSPRIFDTEFLDLSPTSGSVRGGTKVLMCFACAIPVVSPVRVLFTPVIDAVGESENFTKEVDITPQTFWGEGELLSSSIIRCHTPPQPSGQPCRCQISLYCSEGRELIACLPMCFQYTQVITPYPLLQLSHPSTSKGKKRPSHNVEVRDFHDECLQVEPIDDAGTRVGYNSAQRGSNKIRVVEKLLGNVGSRDDHVKSRSACHDNDKNDDWLDDTQLLGLSSSDLEGLTNQFLLRVVKQLVNLATVDEDLLAGSELDSLDASGYSLLHYCCLFNLTSLVARLIDRGANINLKTGCKTTALHLAAGSGHTDVVMQLVDAGAFLTARDGCNCLAADIAAQRGYPDIVALLNGAWQRQSNRMRHPPLGKSCTGDDMIGDKVNFEAKSCSRTSAPNNDSDKDSVISSKETTSMYTSEKTSDISLSMSNMELLHGALSSLSLTDKCALSLSMSLTGQSSDLLVNEQRERGRHSPDDFEVKSALSETDVESLDVAMSMMGPQELSAVENEVKLIQSNVRTWLLRKNYTNLRDAARTLQLAWREHRGAATSTGALTTGRTFTTNPPGESSIAMQMNESHRSDFGCSSSSHPRLASKSIDDCAATLQAATRGMLARKSFQRAKKQTIASLVIFQWWIHSKSKSSGNSHHCREEITQGMNLDEL